MKIAVIAALVVLAACTQAQAQSAVETIASEATRERGRAAGGVRGPASPAQAQGEVRKGDVPPPKEALVPALQ